MNRLVLCALAIGVVVLSACTTTRQVATAEFRPPSGGYRIIVMRPDVSVGVLTAGGGVELRDDWSEQARQNLLAALQTQQNRHGGSMTVASTLGEAGADQEAVARPDRLHGAVGRSIQLHKYTDGQKLPTKKFTFDWTLGELAVAYGRSSGYDYALFLHAEDSFSSGGRVALQAVGMLGCVVGVCVMPAGGHQIAFASLVDLKSGQVVWYNFLLSSRGDIRTPKGAGDMVEDLLDEMKPGKPAKNG